MEHNIEIVWTTHSINKNGTGNRLFLGTFMSSRRMFIEQEEKCKNKEQQNLTTKKLLARIGENKIWERFHEQTRSNGDVVVGEWRKRLLSLVERGGGAWEWGKEVGGCATTRPTHMQQEIVHSVTKSDIRGSAMLRDRNCVGRPTYVPAPVSNSAPLLRTRNLMAGGQKRNKLARMKFHGWRRGAKEKETSYWRAWWLSSGGPGRGNLERQRCRSSASKSVAGWSASFVAGTG